MNARIERSFVLLAVVIAVFFCITDLQAASKMKLTMGSTSSSSGLYVGCATLASVINKYAPGVEITIVESGATHDNLVKMRRGLFNMATSIAGEGACMAYSGTLRNEYKKAGPYSELRLLPSFVLMPIYNVIVNEGPYAKINSISELNGVKYSAGITGSGCEFNTSLIFKALNIQPKWVPGSYTDVVGMAKDLQLAGFAKAMTHYQVDSSVLDLMSARKVKILGYTSDQLVTALKTVPGLARVDVPAGAIQAIPNQPAFSVWAFNSATVATTKIPQEIGYQMCKALWEHWDEMAAAYKGAAKWKPMHDDIDWWTQTIKAVGEGAPPFHSGMVQYLHEKGLTVPDKLIPAEYQKK